MSPSKHRILIADDEDSYRSMISSELTNASYDVVSAADGEEAVAHLAKKNVDLALLDVRMPKRDGIQVLEYIKNNCPKTKAIILTGFADLDMAMSAKALGAVDFLNKPFKLEELIEAVQEALAH